MNWLEKLGNNPLIVSLITIAVTTVISIVGYMAKKAMTNDKKEQNDPKRINHNQNQIVQNFNTGMNYSDVKRIAEEVVDRKLSKMKKQ